VDIAAIRKLMAAAGDPSELPSCSIRWRARETSRWLGRSMRSVFRCRLISVEWPWLVHSAGHPCVTLFGVQVILTAIDDGLAEAWSQFCGQLDFVIVHRGSILDLQCDAVVSPANSFGFMEGGVDASYLKYFGAGIGAKVRKIIAERYHGEMLVGTAEIVETGDERIPHLIVAPTMRVPMVLTETVNPFLAARAVFLLIKHGHFSAGTYAGEPIAERIKCVAFPGLGTGVGRVGPGTSAHQMRAAIEEVVLGRRTSPRSWVEASEQHQLLYTTRMRRLQHD